MEAIEIVFQNSSVKISELLRTTNLAELSKLVGSNASGDQQKKLDDIANEIVANSLKNINEVRGFISEENDEITWNNNTGSYFVTYDPLDGSSNIDSNISIGTIFSVFKYDNSNNIIDGKNIVMSGYSLYGPSTLMMVAKEKNVILSQYYNDKWVECGTNIFLPNKGKMYAINESAKYKWNYYVNDFINTLIYNKYSARWVGSLVADVHRTLIKGGLVMYPSNMSNPNGKIRLLYEAYPMAYIFHQLGGFSWNEKCNILDQPFSWDNIHKRTPIYFFGKYEYDLLFS